MYKLLIVFLGAILLFNIEAFADAPKPGVKPVHHTLNIDSTVIKPQHFNGDALKRYAKQKEFIYDDSAPESTSLWERFWAWFWHKIGNFLAGVFDGSGSWILVRILIFTLAAVALAFIIFRVLGIDVIRIFRGESQNIEIPYGESLENIHAISFENEIENAVSNRNYRLAVRLLYLRCLKQLSDAQLIHWQIEKTNASYINELAETEYRQLFSLLTTRFEYIWYGDFPIDGQAFQNINALFADFKKALP